MKKGSEVPLLSGSSSGSGSRPTLAAQLKEKRYVIIFAVAAAAIVVGVVLYLVLGGPNCGKPDKGKCDLFKGQWVQNPSGPSYNDKSCKFIDDAVNCLKNGRPDTQYLFWKWQPRNCDLPPFDPLVFMNSMRNKSWAFIGDSFLRNQMQSLICLVSKVEEPIEIYHDVAYKSRNMYFPNHNFTIANIWAPFLVKTFGDGNDEAIQVFLDIPGTDWTTQYHKYDYVVIAGGHWFFKTMVFWENGNITGCHNCEETKFIKELGVYDPYRKALQAVFNFITTSDHKPHVVFRTWTADHFEYTEWFSKGVCNRSVPYKEGEFNGSPIDQMMRTIELEGCEKARDVASKRGIQMELLDTFHLSMLRPDGHPGPYVTLNPFGKSADVQNDCLLWCVPGPVDAWNDLMIRMLWNSGALDPTASYQKAVQGLNLVSF